MWTLVSSRHVDTPGSSNEVGLPEEGTAHIVLGVNAHHFVVVRALIPRLQGMQRELGRIVAGPFGVKLEAVVEKLTITPGQAHPASASPAKFELQPRDDDRTEAIFLRHGDVINFPSSESSLTCKWSNTEIQVNSSAAPDANGVGGTPEDETEDEDLNEHTVASLPQNNRSRPRATPQLPHQQSLVVQETPTAARVNSASNSVAADINPPNFAEKGSEPVKDTPIPSRELEPEPEPVPEAFSTARTGESQDKPPAPLKTPQNATVSLSADVSTTGPVAHRDGVSLRVVNNSSPQVQIPPKSSRKRSTSAMEDASESEHEALAGPIKRAKTSDDEDTQNSRLSNIEVASRKSAKKGKKRLSEVVEVDTSSQAKELSSTKSRQSSQQSIHTTAETYDAPPPRVASSNSTITKTSQAVKLLKKQGGAYVEKLSDDFNVLCVRDGNLQKKAKVLYAIARGIPIVTDTWLLESAKEGRLLPLSAYKPSIAKQEKEWKFKFDNVFGQPQRPLEGYNLHFTKSLKATFESFPEITAVCTAAGAESVTSTRMKSTGESIVLANNPDDDQEVQKLMKDGVTCYTKDLFMYSIFRGVLDLDSDEFKMKPPAADSTPSKEKKKRGRKST